MRCFITGVACGLPYNVTLEEALKHEEVKSRLASSITKLKQVTTMFLATIVKARAKVPYGISYMAKVLHMALKSKFPNVSEKDLLKIVGNLIYYRYINSAIVAPDAFNIVDISLEKGKWGVPKPPSGGSARPACLLSNPN